MLFAVLKMEKWHNIAKWYKQWQKKYNYLKDTHVLFSFDAIERLPNADSLLKFISNFAWNRNVCIRIMWMSIKTWMRFPDRTPIEYIPREEFMICCDRRFEYDSKHFFLWAPQKRRLKSSNAIPNGRLVECSSFDRWWAAERSAFNMSFVDFIHWHRKYWGISLSSVHGYWWLH